MNKSKKDILDELVEFVFENSLELPNDFYVNIMDLIKKNYEQNFNFFQIHEFIEKNQIKISLHP